MDVPDVRYARAGGVAIAYQVVGDGPIDLVYSPHLCDLLTLWMSPLARPVLDRLAGETRLVVFNPRGTGISDRPRNVSLEARMDDISAVLDAVGIGRANLLGASTSANVCALYAATYPERCERVLLFRAYPRGVRSETYPFGSSEEEWLSWIRKLREHWGEREFQEREASGLETALLEDPEVFDWHVWMQRLAVSPGAAADWARIGMETDISDVLGSIRVPALILHRADEREVAEFVRGRIPDAELTEIPGLYTDETVDAVLEFVRGDVRPTVPESVLATVLFTDLVGSTTRAAEVGDRVWRDVLAAHHRSVRSELRRHRGIEVDTAGDGFFCRFDGPARAISCARRIVQLAGPGDVLVSGTVKDLVAGSDLAFEDRGEHELKGVPGSWRLYAVVDG